MNQPGIDDYMPPIPGWMLLIPVAFFALARWLSRGQVVQTGHPVDKVKIVRR